MVVAASTLIQPALQSPRSVLAVNSYGYLITRWAKRKLGLEHGPWQEYAIERIFEHDAQGDLLAKLALVSVGRQNGKSVIVRSIAGWMLDEGYGHPAFEAWKFILLAAHDGKQARIPYEYIRRDIESHTKFSYRASGRGVRRTRATMMAGIENNGVTVDVATRQAGSARGISPGLVCFDEVLTQTDFSMYEVLSPSLSAIHNSMMLMTSTAGYADSVLLRSVFDRLERQAKGAERHDPSFMGLWWRANRDDAGLDWDELRLANPALDDGRLSRRSIESEFAILPKGSWTRERLNRWSDERVNAPFSYAQWGACRTEKPLDLVIGKYIIAVDVQADWSEGSVVVAAMRDGGRVGVEVHAHLQQRPNTPLSADDFVREIKQVAEKVTVERVLCTQASALYPALQRFAIEQSFPIEALTATKINQACHDFAEAISSRRLAHDDPFLDSEIQVAQRRYVGGEGNWRWAISPNPVTSVVAATMAVAYADKAVSPLQVFL